jgi:drug/metabolite transporter (DMT)-like permease
VAVFGTALLAYDPSHSSLDLNVGDAWSIAAAASSAMFILRLEAATKAVSNSAALNAACLWVVTGSSLLWTLGQGMFEASSIAYAFPHVWDNILYTMQSHPIELVYLSAVTTALANYIQTRAQRNVSAERASVIYAMDPVYGAFFSFWLLGERLTSTGIVGASLITLAAATSAFLDLGKSQEEESSDLHS